MKRFVIKTTYQATSSNENFKGETQIWYSGVKHNTCRMDGNEVPNYLNTFIKYYGYTTKAAATRALNCRKDLADWEMLTGHWNVTTNLVEIEL